MIAKKHTMDEIIKAAIKTDRLLNGRNPRFISRENIRKKTLRQLWDLLGRWAPNTFIAWDLWLDEDLDTVL